MAESGGLLNRCRGFKLLPRVRIPASPPVYSRFVIALSSAASLHLVSRPSASADHVGWPLGLSSQATLDPAHVRHRPHLRSVAPDRDGISTRSLKRLPTAGCPLRCTSGAHRPIDRNSGDVRLHEDSPHRTGARCRLGGCACRSRNCTECHAGRGPRHRPPPLNGCKATATPRLSSSRCRRRAAPRSSSSFADSV